jgi:hypothetical protein
MPLVINCDFPCIRCGYNLRTLTPSHSCPECQHPVARSLDLSAYAWPLPRLRRVTQTVKSMAISGAIAIGFVIVGLVFIYLTEGGALCFAIFDAIAIAAWMLVYARDTWDLTLRIPCARPLQWTLRCSGVAIPLAFIGLLLTLWFAFSNPSGMPLDLVALACACATYGAFAVSAAAVGFALAPVCRHTGILWKGRAVALAAGALALSAAVPAAGIGIVAIGIVDPLSMGPLVFGAGVIALGTGALALSGIAATITLFRLHHQLAAGEPIARLLSHARWSAAHPPTPLKPPL